MVKTIKKILVTGSSGTIGTRVCEKLLEKDYEITPVDWRANKWSSDIDKRTLSYDLRDSAVFNKLPRDFDLILHLAANARVYNLVENPVLARDNMETLFNTLEFAKVGGIKKFIFASSREVYGNAGKTIYAEEDAWFQNCESPYTASKIGGEAFLHAYAQCYGLDYIIFRFSNVYGMYDESDRVVPLFVRLTREQKDLSVFGKDKLLDFTYIDDCVAGVMKAIENFEHVKNDTYNLASGQGTSIIQVAELIKELMEGKNDVVIKENRTGEIIKFVAEISKAKEKLGWTPKVGIQEGIKRAVGWYSQNA